MSTLRVNTIQDSTGSSSPAINGLAKAWVNFNGTGTVAIRASLNVSSITDNGTGNYTVNFAAALTDSNYAAVCGIRKADSTNDGNMGVVLGSTATEYSTTQLRVITRYFSNEGLIDGQLVNIAVFR